MRALPCLDQPQWLLHLPSPLPQHSLLSWPLQLGFNALPSCHTSPIIPTTPPPLHSTPGCGFFINSWLVMLSVYVNIWVILLMALVTDSGWVLAGQQGGCCLCGRVLCAGATAKEQACYCPKDTAHSLLHPLTPTPTKQVHGLLPARQRVHLGADGANVQRVHPANCAAGHVLHHHLCG